MKKTSRLTRISLMLALFFGIDKLLGVFRTIIIGRQFGLSEELDVFNAANNLPDLLFALISGGALAIAFIPVLSEILSKSGKKSAWRLFSKVANLAFIVTLGLAIIVGLLAGPLVRGQLGIAPGFTPDQQALVIRFMRLNLISTLIFSISGLVMAGLQANQHFILPAIAPLVYDIGQIFGALILAPDEGLQIVGFKLPAFGLGIDGLVYGVIIGAALHLLVQIPGLLKYGFKWSPILDFKDDSFRRVLRLMGPRLISMIFIQLIFLARDNLASRLATGSVTALNYGWWIQQVPETLIGTAIATALLPTLSEYVAAKDKKEFKSTIERSLRVMIALSLPITVILSLASLPWIQLAFGFPAEEAHMVLWATRGYLVGLLGHSVVELGVRAFYARQNARIPMLISAMGFLVYVGLAIPLMGTFASGGIALANSISYSIQAIILIILLNRQLSEKFKLGSVFLRATISAAAAGLCAWMILLVLPIPLRELYLSFGAILFGGVVAVIPIWRDMRLLRRL
ncbi:MAG: murein biosynthesis integral membrane protein MurJ [Chloroflexota bacterium]|nr:murein biosynthesis integral membrane protein MurJ [Chloroflexota bacterium]